MLTKHSYFYKHVLSDMVIYLSKEEKTYIFVKLFKQYKKRIKQLENAI